MHTKEVGMDYSDTISYRRKKGRTTVTPAVTDGWNMERTMSIDGYRQKERRYAQNIYIFFFHCASLDHNHPENIRKLNM